MGRGVIHSWPSYGLAFHSTGTTDHRCFRRALTTPFEMRVRCAGRGMVHKRVDCGLMNVMLHTMPMAAPTLMPSALPSLM